MSKGTTSYRIVKENALHFLTFSTVNWIDVFSGKKYRDIVIESLQYCQAEKGLELYGFVIMSNHIHLLVRAKEDYKLSAIMRDMKKHTSKKILKMIKESNESRKEWLLSVMLEAGGKNSKKQTYQLWRNDNHPIELYKPETTRQKLNYIHNNPVEAGIVERAEEYVYSSAKNYAGELGILNIEFI
jgi:REP element-mobilizing transposase RayT|tara:strand:+ start:114 stop:668 length:555 start_codon:yes stop_codon:yes gene_type:complete